MGCVKKGFYQGLLLPQVAPENDFDAIDFLNHTCLKAGLAPAAWLTGADVYWFKGQILRRPHRAGILLRRGLISFGMGFVYSLILFALWGLRIAGENSLMF